MVAGVIGASGAIVQKTSVAYNWGLDDVWIQARHQVGNLVLDPM